MLSVLGKGAWSRVILFIVYSFPAILLIESYGKTRNSQSNESRNQNPTYGILARCKHSNQVNLHTHSVLIEQLIVYHNDNYLTQPSAVYLCIVR